MAVLEWTLMWLAGAFFVLGAAADRCDNGDLATMFYLNAEGWALLALLLFCVENFRLT